MDSSTDTQAIFKRTIPVVTYDGTLYTVVDGQNHVIDYSPRRVDAQEGALAHEEGQWVGYELGQAILKATGRALEADAAVRYLNGGTSTDIMLKLRNVAEAERSSACDQLSTLNRVAICRSLDRPE